MTLIKGEVRRIRRYWNILVSDAELDVEEELGGDEEKDQGGDA